MSSKEPIEQDNKNPLWREILKRFPLEIKAAPDKVPDTNAFYYKETRGRLRVTDYNWFLLDGTMLLREKKEGS